MAEQDKPWISYDGDEQLNMDFRGMPSHKCMGCGSETFKILASFEDYEISEYHTDAICASCSSWVTIPTPLDDPEYDSDKYEDEYEEYDE